MRGASMAKKNAKQERGRKYGGSSSFVDAPEPSKAPRQDEDDTNVTETPEVERQYANDSSKPVSSSRTAKEEHEFHESSEPSPEPYAPDSVEVTTKQVGGNRGGV